MYLAHYDTDGTIKGFYLTGLHSAIPTPTIEITEEQHKDFFANDQNYKVIDGSFTFVEPPEPETQIITPEVNSDIADLWQAMLDMSAELEALKGGK